MESDGQAIDRYVAGNLRAIRGSKGMSQTKVAREMNARGRPWHQTTVGRIESGAQEVGIGEAADLAAVLGVALDRLIMPSDGASEIAAAEETAEGLRLSWIAAVKSIRGLRRASGRARDALPEASASKYPRMREIAAEITAGLEEYTLESALSAAEAEES